MIFIMSTIVTLIRHGETEWNKLGKFQGGTDIELSENGRKQAEKLKERIDGDFDYIYSSPLKRAYETACMVAEGTGKKVQPVHGLREIGFGEWEGLTVKEISEKYPEVFKEWRTDKKEGKFCGGDSSTLNASVRAKNAVMDIVKNHQGSRIIIVAHGGIIKAALIGLFGWDMDMYHKILQGNTCLNTIRFNDDLTPVIMGINDTVHLSETVTSV